MTPFDSPPRKTSFIGGSADYLQKAYATTFGGKLRVAWLNANANQPNAVDYYNDTGGTPSVLGPKRTPKVSPTEEEVANG